MADRETVSGAANATTQKDAFCQAEDDEAGAVGEVERDRKDRREHHPELDRMHSRRGGSNEHGAPDHDKIPVRERPGHCSTLATLKSVQNCTTAATPRAAPSPRHPS